MLDTFNVIKMALTTYIFNTDPLIVTFFYLYRFQMLQARILHTPLGGKKSSKEMATHHCITNSHSQSTCNPPSPPQKKKQFWFCLEHANMHRDCVLVYMGLHYYQIAHITNHQTSWRQLSGVNP